MKDAVEWVRTARSNKTLSPNYQHYLIKDLFLHATDGRMTVGYPFPVDGLFCPQADPFTKLVDRLPDPIFLVAEDDDYIALKSGRQRGKVKCMDATEWLYPLIDAPWLPISQRLLPALRQLRPFVSDNAAQPWALCVELHGNCIYATNNIAAVIAPDIDLDQVDTALLPYWAIDFLLAHEEGLVDWCHGSGYLGFRWQNGAWMRTQQVDATYPRQQITEVINKCGYAKHPITEEWRAAFAELANLVDDYVYFMPDKMLGSEKDLDAEVEMATPTPELGFSHWSIRYLKPVLEMATHWEPTTYPSPSPFRGDGIVGIVIGRQAHEPIHR